MGCGHGEAWLQIKIPHWCVCLVIIWGQGTTSRGHYLRKGAWLPTSRLAVTNTRLSSFTQWSTYTSVSQLLQVCMTQSPVLLVRTSTLCSCVGEVGREGMRGGGGNGEGREKGGKGEARHY